MIHENEIIWKYIINTRAETFLTKFECKVSIEVFHRSIGLYEY